MKLWLLKPVAKNLRGGRLTDPWEPYYDKAFEFVIRAESKDDARKYAADDAGDEGAASWLDPKWSTCDELTNEGEPGIIIQDFCSA